MAGCECCLLCRQAAWRHRVVSCCSAVLVSGRLAWAAYMGRSCQAAWQGRWLHLVVKLFGGRVHIVSWVVKMTGDIEQAVASCSDCKGLGSNCGAFVSLGGSQRLKRHSSKRQLRGVTMPQRRRLHHGWTWVTPLRRQASISAQNFQRATIICQVE